MSETLSRQTLIGLGLPPRWNTNDPAGVVNSEGKVKVDACSAPIGTCWKNTPVNGSTPSWTTALMLPAGSPETVNRSVYVEPFSNGISFCPIPASHGLARPPGMVAQS